MYSEKGTVFRRRPFRCSPLSKVALQDWTGENWAGFFKLLPNNSAISSIVKPILHAFADTVGQSVLGSCLIYLHIYYNKGIPLEFFARTFFKIYSGHIGNENVIEMQS